MKAVGDHLAAVARERGNLVESDLFGRSAFNRYYYSVFLVVRSALVSIDEKWARSPHAQLPVLLTGKVLMRVREQSKDSVSIGVMNLSERESILSKANTAASDLSNLLRHANEIRRIADYEPVEMVTRAQRDLTLHACSLETAGKWEARASAHVGVILKAYKRVGLISA